MHLENSDNLSSKYFRAISLGKEISYAKKRIRRDPQFYLRGTIFLVLVCLGFVTVYVVLYLNGAESMTDGTLDYFLRRGEIKQRDAAEVRWSHAVNSRSKLEESLKGPTHMLEADIIMRGRDPREPIMAHPPDTDSDITLKEWLEAVKPHGKGIKLDFKSLEAVPPSVLLLEETERPVWINADVLPGPGGVAKPLEAQAFLSAVEHLPRQTVLSLGWTTGWTAGTDNPGYSWDMVHEMEAMCRGVHHAVTFPVRAALLAQSFSQLSWLLQQSHRYGLTVWTGQKDEYTLEELLAYRTAFDRSRIYYDLPEHLRTQLSGAPPRD